jgi:hypothetical protein
VSVFPLGLIQPFLVAEIIFGLTVDSGEDDVDRAACAKAKVNVDVKIPMIRIRQMPVIFFNKTPTSIFHFFVFNFL